MSETPKDKKDPEEIDLSEIQHLPEDDLPEGVYYARDVSIDDLLEEQVSTLTDEDRKKIKQVLYGALGVILLVIVLSIFSCQPKTGPMAYGICSTFLELTTPYPNTLNYTELEGSRTALRIYFTNIDPFGEYKLEMIECTFGPDEAGTGMKLTQVTRNRRPVDSRLVSKFNETLPIIMASDPYLVVPPEWENQLVLKREN
jgi:hypothetical protein